MSMVSRLLVGSFLLLSVGLFGQTAYTISTVAGHLPPDTAPGISVPLNYPSGITADKGGNVYIVERQGARVRKLSPDGTVTPFAGNGVSGFRSAASAPATQEPLYQPTSMAFGPNGDAYITDSQSVLRVNAAGELSTVAEISAITKGSCATGDHHMRFPDRIAVGADGVIYLSSYVEDRVCKLLPDGSLVAVAGTGESGFGGDGGLAVSAQLYDPNGLAVDDAGDLYIADTGNNRIRKVTPDGMIQTIAGGGASFEEGAPALAVRLTTPYGVALGPQGNVYIVNTFASSILKIAADGSIRTVAGGNHGFAGDGGPAVQASLLRPEEITFAQGDLYIADSDNNRVRKVDAGGVISTVVGNGNFTGDGGPAVQATLFEPWDVALDSQNDLFVADTSNHVVRKVDSSGVITTVAGAGTQGNSGDGGPATQAHLAFPRAVDVDKQGDLYILDSSNYRVQKVDPSQTIQTIAGPETGVKFVTPYGMAVDRNDGSIYVADSLNYQVFRIAPDGTIATVAGTGASGFSGDGGPATQAQISFSAGVAVDGKGNVFIADTNNQRIRKVAPDGTISTVAGRDGAGFSGDGGQATAAYLSYPYGVAVDGDGNLYISDSGNNRIRRVDASGIITTVAGSGTAGFAGDGGPATLASIYNPRGIAVGSDGSVYFADSGSDRIRKLTPGASATGEISLVNAASFASGDVTPGMIVSIYGSNLAAALATPSGADLPQVLGETSVEVGDRLGVSRQASLYFVSPNQINCVIPDGTAKGAATIIVQRNGVAVASADVQVATVAPALFSANADGMGVAAANVLRVSADGSQTVEPVAVAGDSGKLVAAPIDLGPESDKVYLLLYGTGIRGSFGNLSGLTVTVGGQDVPLIGAAPQSQYAGLDQVNIGPLPRELAGSGSVTVHLSALGSAANPIKVEIK